MAEVNKVVVHIDGTPKDEPVEVLHLGVFKNGGTYNLTDEQVANYEAQTGGFPKSGYIVIGNATTKEAKEAAEANAKVDSAQVTNQPEIPDPTDEQVEAAAEIAAVAPANPILSTPGLFDEETK